MPLSDVLPPTIQIGIVGLGKMGLLHASLVGGVGGARVAAVCERQAVLRRFARRMLPHVAVVRDVTELAGRGLDGVYVTTPPDSHFSVVSALLTHKIARHLFVEKPLAASGDQALELTAMVGRVSGTHMVGYQKRFAVTFVKAREVLGSGVLGEITSVEAYGYSSDFAGAPRTAEMHARGGVLRDLGCHAIDMLLWFFGDATVISASAFRVADGDPIDSVSARLQTSSGALTTLSVSACMPDYRLPETGITVAGSRGRMTVNDDVVEVHLASSAKAVWHRHTLADQVSFRLGETEYTREDECFLRGVAEGTAASPGFGEGLKVELVIDQIHSKL